MSEWGRPMVWRCVCGSRPWLHYENCPTCGAEKPPPPAEPKPSDEPITEPGPHP